MHTRTHARRLVLGVVSAAALTGAMVISAPAKAATSLTLTTADRPLDVPSDVALEPYTGFNQGWWSLEYGHDSDGYDNTNVATGFSEETGVTRSFFTFHLGKVTRTVTSATLRLPRGCATSEDSSELVKLWDVTTPAVALNRGTAPAESTFRDIGGGREYGRATVSTAAGGSAELRVKLNATAVAALNAGRGSRYFSVGAAVMTLNKRSGDELVFGCTGDVPASLVVTTR